MSVSTYYKQHLGEIDTDPPLDKQIVEHTTKSKQSKGKLKTLNNKMPAKILIFLGPIRTDRSGERVAIAVKNAVEAEGLEAEFVGN